MIDNYRLIDVLENGWPEDKEIIKYYDSVIHDVPNTINNSLKILKEKNVQYALVYVPTNYRLVKNNVDS